MAELDLGTLRGHVDLDIAAFDRKYGEVEKLLTALERRKDPELSVNADTMQAESRLSEIQDSIQRVDGESGEVTVTAGTDTAERAIDAVEQSGEQLARREFDPQIDADITEAQAKVGGIGRELEVLRRMDASPTVTADITRAERNLGDAQSQVRALDGMRAEMVVDADTSPAETAMADVSGEAESSGASAGQVFMGAVLGGLAATPIVGAVAGILEGVVGGVVTGVQEALNVELSRDMFSARTGLDSATANRFGRAAGEAYAGAFGESTEANLDVARQALQQGLIDEDATQAEIQSVIENLTGITDVFEYDIPEASRAVGQMLKTGLVADADEAFDLIARTSQGAISDDLMDTLIEYSGQFELVGLSGEQAMGLIRQAMDAGARDTDKVGDAVKEMGLRIREGTEPAREALGNLGVDVESVIAGFTDGGPAASDAMGVVFDALRRLDEDGGNTAEVIANLFGGPGEDLGAALFALDLGTAQQALGDTEGAARSMLDTLGDNAATELESAKRNIEVAAEGIQGALASAFSDEISGAAEWVQANRAPIMEFFADAANMAFDLAGAFIDSAATGTEAFGDFVGTTGPAVMDLIGAILEGLDSLPFVDLGDARDEFDKLREGADVMFGAIDDGSAEAADLMRDNLGGGIADSQDAFNEWVGPEIMTAKVHDATVAMAGRLDELSAVIDETGGTVTINGETLNADEALESLVGSINEETGEVTINGMTVPADEALSTLMGAIATSEDNVTIAATRAPADEALSALMAAVAASKENVTIGGNKLPADEALNRLMTAVSLSSDDVTIGGNDYPAKSVLGQLMGAVRNGRDNVTIGGNDYPAGQVLSNLLGVVGRSGASISVGADISAAIGGINAVVNMANNSRGTILVGAGQTGFMAEGGPVIGPGTGTSDDVPIMGSNGEYMIKAAAVDKYGMGLFDSLNAMHLAEGGPVTTGSPASSTYSPAYQSNTAPGAVAVTAPPVEDHWHFHNAVIASPSQLKQEKAALIRTKRSLR